MLNIVLLCAGGASTGMLAKKMQEEADKAGLKASIRADGIGVATTAGANADIILLGPQVGYRAKEVEAALPGKPISVMNMMDYGRINAKKILVDAIKTVKKARAKA